MTKWTNRKAVDSNAGEGGSLYPTWTRFSVDEIQQHIGLYFLNGLNPTPDIRAKFHSTKEPGYELKGSDFVHEAFGGKAATSELRHRQFKCFFATVNPREKIPPRTEMPNHKVHKLLKQCIIVLKSAIIVGRVVSVDEMDVGFQGNHIDKQRISFKRKGDGFLTNALCLDGGYCYTFYFRNQPVPKKYLDKGYSPLHAQVLALLDQLPSKHNYATMDSLFILAKFVRAAWVHPTKTMVAGVCRSEGRGVPKIVEQEAVTKKEDLNKKRGTLKAAILENDENCKGLVVVSLYDTKPVYLMSNQCTGIRWIEKTRKVWNAELGKMDAVKYHRLEIIDNYNKRMGMVDLADQLRENYRIDYWMRKTKWWWAIAFWAIQLLMTNAWVLYKKYHELHGLKMEFSHYSFIEAVGKAWVEPAKYRVWLKKEKKRRKAAKVAATHQSILDSPSSNTRSSARATSFEMPPLPGTTQQSLRRILNLTTPSLVDSTITGPSLYSIDNDDFDPTVARCRAVKFDDSGLDPDDGRLKKRLDNSLPHLPVPDERKQSRCQMHYWLSGNTQKYYASKMQCFECNVVLCVKCFMPYHTMKNLIQNKDYLKLQLGIKDIVETSKEKPKKA